MTIYSLSAEQLVLNISSEFKDEINEILIDDKDVIKDIFTINDNRKQLWGIVRCWKDTLCPNLRLFLHGVYTEREQINLKKQITSWMRTKYKDEYILVNPPEYLEKTNYYDRHIRMEKESQSKSQKVKVDFSNLSIIERFANNQMIIDLHNSAFDGESYLSINWNQFYGKSDFKKPDGFNLAILDDELLIGIVVVDSQTDFCRVVSLAVAPKFKNQRLGRKIMLELFDRLPDKKWRLGVYENNKSAIRLYTSLGFKNVKTNSLVWKLN